MKALLQRVTRASVSVDGEVVGSIGPGLVVFVGVADGDTVKDAQHLAEKTVNLRIFADEAPTLKRYRASARRRVSPILKRSSHITVIVAGQEG